MPFQSPVNQLRPVQPPPDPLERFAKVAAIQDMIEGRGLRRQELELRNQAMQNEQAMLQRKQAAFQRVTQIMSQAGGDMEKATDLILADGELMQWAPDYVKAVEQTAQRRKPKYTTLQDVVDAEGQPHDVVLEEGAAAKLGPLPTYKAPPAKSDFMQQYEDWRHAQPLGSDTSQEAFRKMVAKNTPTATDLYGERVVVRNGKEWIETYAKNDPEAKTLSVREKGPYVPPTVILPTLEGIQSINKISNQATPVTTKTGQPVQQVLSAELQTKISNANAGLDAVKTLRAELKKPGMSALLAIPGSPGARTARAARDNMVDIVKRLRSGAATNSIEDRTFRSMAPGLLDALNDLFSNPDASVIEYKLSAFENQMKSLSKPIGPLGPASGSGDGGGKKDPLGIR